MVRTFKLKPWVYAGLLALSPLSADAAGLGKLTVTSALGQPLRAEIELVSVQKGDLDSLVARLASEDAFKEAKIERGGALLGLRFSVEQKKDGQPVLRLTTVQPVNEPFLDMLVELNWSAGRLLREYTVLLDPPGFAEPQAVQPVIVPSLKPAQIAPSTQAMALESPPAPNAIGAKPGKSAAKPAERKPAAAEAAPAESRQAQAPETKDYGPVKKGETLTGIASQLRPGGYSLEQMLVALYQSNKQAFSGKNMNRLKSGQILRVPEEQQLAALGRAEAVHEVRAHTADWNAYRQKLSAAVEEAPAPKEAAPKQVAKGKITTAVEDKAAPPPAPSKDVLKVTKGEAPAGGKEMQVLQSKVQSLQEETIAREKSLKEANDRIATLEKSIKEMQQLIEVKNKNLAELQKQAAAKPEAAPAAKPAEAPAKPAGPAAEKPAEAAKPVEEKPMVAKPRPAPAKPRLEPVAPPPEPGLLDSISGNPLYLAGGAAALIALGGGALVAINRRRRKSLSSFEDSILTGGELKANTIFGETAGGVVDTGDTSFLTDFSQAGLGTIDTNDVDPIAEAEVYMAYGRDAQAEEILKEAMAKDPNRHEIHLKLLEIYAARKNLIVFETLAGELYAATGGHGAIWEKAAEMGRALDPNNPLYGIKEGAGAKPAAEMTPAAAAFASVDLGEPTQGLMQAAEAAEVEEPSEDLSHELDFSVDEASPLEEAEVPAEEPLPGEPLEPEPEAAEEEIGALEFDLGSFGETPAAAPPAEEAEALADTGQGMDFDLGDLMPEQPLGEAEAEPEPAAVEDLVEELPQAESLELDLDALMPQAESGGEVQAGSPADVAEKEEESMDFSLDFPEMKPEPAAEPEATPAAAVEEESIVIESAPIAEEEEPHLDFDFDLGAIEAPAPAAEPSPEAMPALDLSGISLDLEEPAAQAGAEEAAIPAESEIASAEVATKLDLARAYVEMGDSEGAKEILAEVLKEGSPQQQAEANQLLASL